MIPKNVEIFKVRASRGGKNETKFSRPKSKLGGRLLRPGARLDS